MPQEQTYSTAGDEILKTIHAASNFTNWMYAEIKPYLSGNILELGSGIGTYSGKIVGDFKKSTIVLSDIDENKIRNLENRFQSDVKVVVKKIDLNKQDDFNNINIDIDSILALNVLEHIEDDITALNSIYNAFKPGGKLVILVPAHKILFNCIDKAIGHYRRYSRQDIINRVKQTQFKIVRMFYFNFAAIPGWYLNGNVFKKSVLNEGAVNLFNNIVPILRIIERYILFRRLGISLIVVLAKPDIK